MSVPLSEAEDRAARQLRLRVRALAARGLPGAHLAPGVGRGADPYDARPYAPGDAIREIDWRLLARSGRPSVRRRTAEQRVRLSLAVDRSRSMAGEPWRQASTLAALLALVAGRGSDLVRLFPGGVHRARAIQAALAAAPTDPEARLAAAVREAIRGGSLDALVAIGDGFEPTEALRDALAAACAGRRRGIVFVRIRAAAPATDQTGALRFRDPESAGSRRLDAARTLAAFEAARAAQDRTLRRDAARQGWRLVDASSSEPTLRVLARVLRALER